MANDSAETRRSVRRWSARLDPLAPRYRLVEWTTVREGAWDRLVRTRVAAETQSIEELELRAAALGVDWSLVSREDLFQ